MAEPTTDLRAELAKALADTAATYGRRLGESLRYVLADTALVYVLTVQRAEKPTPHQMRKRAEAERDEARETVDRVRHALDQIRERAASAEYAMYESAFTDAAELLEAALEGVGYV